MSTERKLLRRYLALAHHVEAALEAAHGGIQPPVPAEAVAIAEDLAEALAPIVAALPKHAPEPRNIHQELAGWVH